MGLAAQVVPLASRTIHGDDARTANLRRVLEQDAAAHSLDGVRFAWGKPTWNLQLLLRLAESTAGQHTIRARMTRAMFHWQERRRNMALPLGVFGPGLCIVHLGGLVVNASARVGAHCRIHQFVTIGSKRGKSPTIGDRVWIGPGAVVAGGIIIGDDAVIGANAVVLDDVVAGTTVAGNPARLVSSATGGDAHPIEAPKPRGS